MTMAHNALELHSVSKVYEVGGIELVALDSIDLTVAPNEVVTLLGPSGSGKTTLLSIAGGLLSATSGRVMVGGQDVTDLSSRKMTRFRREKVGFIFQAVNLVPFLTARENLLVVAELARRKKGDSKSRSERLLEELGLGRRMDNLPAQLSGGERQRVAIGRALMNAPELVLVDEPTSALDSDLGQQVMELIVSEVKARGAAAVVVTHDQRITRFGDRILNMADGRIAGMAPRPEWTTQRQEPAEEAAQPAARPVALPVSRPVAAAAEAALRMPSPAAPPAAPLAQPGVAASTGAAGPSDDIEIDFWAEADDSGKGRRRSKARKRQPADLDLDDGGLGMPGFRKDAPPTPPTPATGRHDPVAPEPSAPLKSSELPVLVPGLAPSAPVGPPATPFEPLTPPGQEVARELPPLEPPAPPRTPAPPLPTRTPEPPSPPRSPTMTPPPPPTLEPPSPPRTPEPPLPSRPPLEPPSPPRTGTPGLPARRPRTPAGGSPALPARRPRPPITPPGGTSGFPGFHGDPAAPAPPPRPRRPAATGGVPAVPGFPDEPAPTTAPPRPRRAPATGGVPAVPGFPDEPAPTTPPPRPRRAPATGGVPAVPAPRMPTPPEGSPMFPGFREEPAARAPAPRMPTPTEGSPMFPGRREEPAAAAPPEPPRRAPVPPSEQWRPAASAQPEPEAPRPKPPPRVWPAGETPEQVAWRDLMNKGRVRSAADKRSLGLPPVRSGPPDVIGLVPGLEPATPSPLQPRRGRRREGDGLDFGPEFSEPPANRQAGPATPVPGWVDTNGLPVLVRGLPPARPVEPAEPAEPVADEVEPFEVWPRPRPQPIEPSPMPMPGAPPRPTRSLASPVAPPPATGEEALSIWPRPGRPQRPDEGGVEPDEGPIWPTAWWGEEDDVPGDPGEHTDNWGE
jgi:putative ABC transport system ATP-binding protein